MYVILFFTNTYNLNKFFVINNEITFKSLYKVNYITYQFLWSLLKLNNNNLNKLYLCWMLYYFKIFFLKKIIYAQ